MKKIKIRRKVKIPKKRKRLKYIAVLPSLVTLMNGICGFSAILLASKGPGTALNPSTLPSINISFFAMAGFVIFIGMIADVLDGHVARISKSTSSFGAQLDSLCDAISFGIAPAFLMIKVIEYEMTKSPISIEYPIFSLFYVRIIYLIAIIYAVGAIIRLARFNVEHKDASHSKFAGLPTPAAAGTIISIVVFWEGFLPRIFVSQWSKPLWNTIEPFILWILPLITLAAGILMVSRIPYTHMMHRILKGKKSFSVFLLALFLLLLTIWSIQFVMLTGFFGYTVFGIARAIHVKIKKPKKTLEANTEPSEDTY